MEAPHHGGEQWPWVLSDRRPFSFVRLGDGMTAGDIGLVFAQLVNYNRIEGRGIDALQAGIIEAESLILPGGLQCVLRRSGD